MLRLIVVLCVVLCSMSDSFGVVLCCVVLCSMSDSFGVVLCVLSYVLCLIVLCCLCCVPMFYV